jgi:hypothetical protein
MTSVKNENPEEDNEKNEVFDALLQKLNNDEQADLNEKELIKKYVKKN